MSTSRLWIAVFILPEKINVIQHGCDWERSWPEAPKNVHNFLITVQKISSACDLIAEMLLILKYTIFDLIIQDQVLDYDRPKKCLTIFYGVNLWLWVSTPAGAVKQR